jgi:hypothetical protein
VATDAYSVDSFVATLRGPSFAEAARQIVSEYNVPQEFQPGLLRGGNAHRILFESGRLIMECLTIPQRLFAPSVSHAERVANRLRARASAKGDTDTTSQRIIRGKVLVMPFFALPQMGAIVVAVDFTVTKEDT